MENCRREVMEFWQIIIIIVFGTLLVGIPTLGITLTVTFAKKTRKFRSNAERLKVGMTLNEADTIMGRPADDIVELDKKYKWRHKLPIANRYSAMRMISVTVLVENGRITGVNREF